MPTVHGIQTCDPVRRASRGADGALARHLW